MGDFSIFVVSLLLGFAGVMAFAEGDEVVGAIFAIALIALIAGLLKEGKGKKRRSRH